MIITRTPLRISFAGGGTDIASYYKKSGSGAVVNATIDKYIYIVINKCFSNELILKYSKTEKVTTSRSLEHTLAAACLERTEINRGIEINIISDIPSGTGLGSSSSFTVGLLNALYGYQGIFKTGEELAAEACDIEINILGSPIGKQDQYAAALGGLNFHVFCADESVKSQRLIIKDKDLEAFNSKLMLFYTGRTHRANDILTHQQKNAEFNEYYLNLMKDDAYKLRVLLEHNILSDYDIGELLEHGWYLKRGLANEITTDEINQYYNTIRNAGALGGKLLGAGGGGFLLFYCLPNKQENVKNTTSLQYVPFKIVNEGSKIIYNG